MEGEEWAITGAGFLPNLFSSVIFQLPVDLDSMECESPTQLVFLIRLLTSFD